MSKNLPASVRQRNSGAVFALELRRLLLRKAGYLPNKVRPDAKNSLGNTAE
jgi:hypothetical protein